MHGLVLALVVAIDAAKSGATFSVQHIFVEHVTGTVPIVSGSIDLPDGSVIPTRVEATLDPKRFKTDEPDRDAALQDPDWFDTKQFPTWTFVSTSIAPSANGFTMNGTLTIHGVSQPETLAVTVGGTKDHPTYHATGQLNRHAFGMSRTRLDPVIGEMVDVTLDIKVP
jgi:polyisoprenoid-binding protein YceI